MRAEHGVRYWYAMMEPSLLRFLQRYGIQFEHIGPLADYHGERQPSFAIADQVLGNMRSACYPVWELIPERGTRWPGKGLEKGHFQGENGEHTGEEDRVFKTGG